MLYAPQPLSLHSAKFVTDPMIVIYQPLDIEHGPHSCRRSARTKQTQLSGIATTSLEQFGSPRSIALK